jgi:hypothetical protein
VRSSRRWKIGGAVTIVAVLGVAGAIALLYQGRPQPLGLAQAGTRTAASSPRPDDPLTVACRPPAVPNNTGSGVAGLWVIQPGSLAGIARMRSLPS